MQGVARSARLLNLPKVSFNANETCGRIAALSHRIKASKAVSLCPHHRQLHEACLTRRVVDTLRSFAVIPGLCRENVVHESLRIAVMPRRSTGLSLHHDPATGEDTLVRCGQLDAVDQ